MSFADQTIAVLREVKRLEPVDRETVTARFPKSKEDAIEQTLRRLVHRGYLEADYRFAHHPRAMIGLARKRIAYMLAAKGRRFFGFDDDQFKEAANERRKYGERGDVNNLPHEAGVSRILAGLLNGKDTGLWSMRYFRNEKLSGTTIRPDLHVTFSGDGWGYVRCFEYERRNRLSKSLLHAKRYLDTFEAEQFDGRVIFIRPDQDQLEDLQHAIAHELKDRKVGDLFYYIAEANWPLTHPELLLKRIFTTSGGKTVPLLTPQTQKQGVA